MIKIDGGKIKNIRESQGLTQLYMATAVEVTTDTISRWENKRYPTIKAENAQKLADALGVTLDEILLIEEENKTIEDNDRQPLSDRLPPESTQQKKIFPPNFLIAALIVLAIVVFSFFYNQQKIPQIISAKRIMPTSAIPDSPFPVVIEIQSTGDEAISIILKELLPPGSKIIETSPSAGSSQNGREAKWIHKLKGSTRFSYLIKINSSIDSAYQFKGTVSTSKNNEDTSVTGADTVRLGKHHWADIDGDNQISDQEILTVFDYYSGINDFTINIEFIEKMWLGSKYTWNKDSNQISISP